MIAVHAGWPIFQAALWSGIDPLAPEYGLTAFRAASLAIGYLATVAGVPLIVIGRVYLSAD
jgi:hypothetical protein